jgi:hypothetical protein
MDPAIPQLSSVTSESLQATIRRLLPSQQGFGVELAATNVITPIIDLTPSAEGSSVPEFMQRAQSYDSQIAFSVANTISTLVNTSGFWQVQGNYAINLGIAQVEAVTFRIDNGLAPKIIYAYKKYSTGAIADINIGSYDILIFLDTGESITLETSSGAIADGSLRQVADVNGNLINPVPFSPQ